MAEFEKPASDTSTGSSERKSRRPRRKSREAPLIGGLAANESLIWARDHDKTPVSKSKKEAENIAKALRHQTRTEAASENTTTTRPESESTGTAVAEKPTTAVESTEATKDKRPLQERKAEHNETKDDDTEQDQKLAELTPEETAHAMDQYIDVRSMEVTAEQVAADPDSPEAAGLQADAEMLDKIRQKRQADPEADLRAVAEAAFQEALRELPPVEPAAAEATPVESADQPEVAPAEAPVMPDQGVEHDHQPPAAGQPPLSPRNMGFPNMPPEYTPTTPEQRLGPLRDVISVEEAAHYARRAETRGLLVGGLVGYFIGRRRGRIKTEKRLIPVQEKLEKQVKTLHDVVADKEARLRQEAARRSAQSHELAAMSRQQEIQKRATAGQESLPLTAAEILPARSEKPVIETAPSLQQPETGPKPFENLPGGPMVQVASEVAAATAAMTATAMERRPEAGPIEPGRINVETGEMAAERVKHLSTSELLRESEKVVIGGERLHDIYADKRISEPGLRHVMMEYARGGDVEKVLQQEIHNKELTFERDPRMRKGLAAKLSEAGGKAAGAAAGTASKLASGSKPLLAAQSERAKTVGKKVVAQVTDIGRKLDDPAKPMQQVVVRTWAVITIILAIIAVILLLR